MPSLSSTMKVRFEPSIPGNSELPKAERFHLLLSSGVSITRMQALLESARDGSFESAETGAKALEGMAWLGSVPLELDGEKVETMEQYLGALLKQSGVPLFLEMLERLKEINSASGAKLVFCERPSGGTASIPAQDK